jgi:hypothetical protein
MTAILSKCPRSHSNRTAVRRNSQCAAAVRGILAVSSRHGTSQPPGRHAPMPRGSATRGYLSSTYASLSGTATPLDVSESKEQLELGGLWRDVVNFFGNQPVEPRLFLPLLRRVLPRWKDWTGFLGYAAGRITGDREELEADAARSELAWQIGNERRDGLRALVRRVARRSVDDQEL